MRVAELVVEDVDVTPSVDAAPQPLGLPGELTFVAPIAGFPDATAFALVELDPSSVLLALRSTEEPQLRFLVVPPAPFFPDYAPVLDDTWVARLGLTGVEDVLLFVVVTPGDSLAASTANLLAPVVVNVRTGAAAQVVLADSALPLRAPLLAP